MISPTAIPRASQPNPFLPPLGSSSRALLLPTIHEPHTFHPYSSLSLGSRGALWSGGVGLVASSIQNAMQTHNAGPLGVFTRTGGTIITFTLMGFAFPFINAVAANVRETDDAINPALGGCAAGFIGGVRRRSFPSAVGACVFLGTAFYTISANGLLLGEPETPETRAARRARYWKPFEEKPLPPDLPVGASS